MFCVVSTKERKGTKTQKRRHKEGGDFGATEDVESTGHIQTRVKV